MERKGREKRTKYDTRKQKVAAGISYSYRETQDDKMEIASKQSQY